MTIALGLLIFVVGFILGAEYIAWGYRAAYRDGGIMLRKPKAKVRK